MPKTSTAGQTPSQINRAELDRARLDGWANAITGVGVQGLDKRKGAKFASRKFSQAEIEELWRGDDMAARVIETVPDEMVRQGFELKIAAKDEARDQAEAARAKDRDQAEAAARAGARKTDAKPAGQEVDESTAKEWSEAMIARSDELDILGSVHEALTFARAFGGGAIILGADDGVKDTAEPLREEAISSFDWLTVLTPEELIPVQWYDQPRAPKFGAPSVYEIRAHTLTGPRRSTARIELEHAKVHESRIVRFDGVKVSRRISRAQNGWGDSVLVRVAEVLADFQQSWASAAILLQEFSIALMKIKGLAELVAQNEDDTIERRAALVNLSKSIANAVIMDADESFERQTSPLAGLPDMLQQFALRLSAAARMPVSLLMGQAPAGLNATGDSDIRWFYDGIKADQTRKLRPGLNRLIRLLFKTKNGPTGGREPLNWTVSFPPLWQLTELQQAELRNKQAQTDGVYLTHQVVTPEEIAQSRFGGDTYSADTAIDLELRGALNATGGEIEDPTDPADVDPTTGEPAPAPAVDPKPDPAAAPTPKGTDPAATPNVQQTALNGAQVQAAQAIVEAVAGGTLPRDAALGMLEIFFQLSPEAAQKVMGTVGTTFTPKAAPAATPPAAGAPVQTSGQKGAPPSPPPGGGEG